MIFIPQKPAIFRKNTQKASKSCKRVFFYSESLHIEIKQNYLIKKKIKIMLIGSFLGSSNPIKFNIHVPFQTLLVVCEANVPLTAGEIMPSLMPVSIKLQNSETGQKHDIVPFIGISDLAEIATYHEGVILATSTKVMFPIMLNPVGNVRLDNNKYMEVEITGSNAWKSLEIYAYSTDTFADFVTKYEKLTIPAGTSRQIFSARELELICLPSFATKFDSIRLTYANGIVTEMTSEELKFHMARTNDMTLTQVQGATGAILSYGSTNESMVGSYGQCAILNLSNVVSIEIIREKVGAAVSYEFITGNFK